jgi:hypothetical protein
MDGQFEAFLPETPRRMAIREFLPPLGGEALPASCQNRRSGIDSSLAVAGV